MSGERYALLCGALALGVLLGGCGPEEGVDTKDTVRAQHVRTDALKVPPANARLNYYGGPVMPNVKVYAVFWGPNVYSQVKMRIGAFFNDLTNSAYMDWLNQYNTNVQSVSGSQGTNQFIGRGTYAGEITIAPTLTSGKVDMRDISTEVVAQLTKGTLPAPDENTLFMIYMPPGVTVTDGNSDTYCTASGSCANHTTVKFNGKRVAYGLLPDFSPGSGCERGCGNAPTGFDNLTGNSSHEMVEAVTDIAVDEANNAPPVAWYDPNTDNEISDICDDDQNQYTPKGGATWWVQSQFTNIGKACILTRVDPVDFEVDLAPRTVSLAPGGNAAVTVHTEMTAGAPGALALSVGSLPVGVTGTLSQSSVSAGQSATLTLSASASAAVVKDFVVAVKATGQSVHTASSLLAVTSGGSTPDAGTPDASVPDAGDPDPGAPDAGASDAGSPMEPSDSGTGEMLSPDAGAGGPGASMPPPTNPSGASGEGCGCGAAGQAVPPTIAFLLIALRGRKRARERRTSAA
jgi:hypothetical protein